MADFELITEEARESVAEQGTNAASFHELRAEMQGLELGTATSSLTDVANSDARNSLRKLQISDPMPLTMWVASVAGTKSRRIKNPSTIAAPEVKWLVRNHHLLTVQVRKILSGFYGIVVSKAMQSNLPISSIVVDAEEDPEERTGQVVLRVYVQASPVQALAFWDSLDIEMNSWLDRLDSTDRNTVIDEVGLRFYWS